MTTEGRLPLALRALGATRWLMVIAVIGCTVIAIALVVHAAIEVGVDLADLFGHGGTSKAGKTLALHAVDVIDRFLLAAVALIVALGVGKLFVHPRVPVPSWLEIDTLDDLKDKLLRVVIVILGVMFLGHVAAWEGGYEIAALAGGIAAVIAALSYFLYGARGRS